MSCHKVLLAEGFTEVGVTNLQVVAVPSSQGAAAADCSLKDVVWTQHKHFWQGLAGRGFHCLSCHKVLLAEGFTEVGVTNLQVVAVPSSQGAAAADCSLKDVVWTQHKHFWQGLTGGRSQVSLSHQRVLLAEGFTAVGHHFLLLLFGCSSCCSGLVC